MSQVKTKQFFDLRKNEQGFIAIEFLLVIPILAFFMLLLMGLSILEKKHQALVAARFATQYETVYQATPSSSTLNKAVGDSNGRWTVVPSKEVADSTSQGELNGEIQKGDGLGLAGIFSGILNFLGGNNKLDYTARSNTFGGIIARNANLGEVQGAYVIETNTWTCKDNQGNNRGSYLSILISKIPFIGGRLGNLMNLSCCETYSSSKDRIQ